MAEISVIVPVYKVEAYLHRCVDSILAQSFPDFDLVLVDDGSPDGCGAICDGYARQDKRIHVIHQENGGLSAARNAGIDWAMANSGSQWLAFVDSDDWVHPNFLLRLYTIVQETGCLLSTCGFFRTEGEDFPALSVPEYHALSADDYYCPEERRGEVPAIACAKLYHKSLFNSLRFPVGKLHEDEFTTYLAVYRAGKVGVTREALYAYYQNPVGIMLSRWTPRRLDILEATENQIAFARENGSQRLMKKAVRQYICSAYEQIGFVKQWQGPEKREYLKMLRKKLRQGLRDGKNYGLYPFSREFSWVYEEAYPMKPFWWLYSRGGQLLAWGKERKQ